MRVDALRKLALVSTLTIGNVLAALTAQNAKQVATTTPAPIRINPTPVLSIGEEQDAELLTVSHVGLASDGTIVITSTDVQKVSVYDRRGRLAFRYGRPGQGPGDFAPYSGMRILGFADRNVAIEDQFNQRVHWVSLTEPTARLEPVGIGAVRGRICGNSWLGVEGGGRARQGSDGRWRFPVAVTRLGTERGTATELFTIESDPRTPVQANGREVMARLPYVPADQVHPAPIGIAVLRGGGNRVEWRRCDGSLVRAMEFSGERALPAAEWERYRAERLASEAPAARAALRAVEALGSPVGRPLPVFERLLVAPDGTLWLGKTLLPGDAQQAWVLVDGDGRQMGVVPAPPGVELLQVTEASVVGVRRDPDGIATAVVHSLSRNGS